MMRECMFTEYSTTVGLAGARECMYTDYSACVLTTLGLAWC